MQEQEHQKRGRGRPGTYASAAERARAWRQRQKDLIDQAQKPVVVERVVERVVEVKVPVQTKATGKTVTPDPATLIPILKNRLVGSYGGEAEAKRLRINCARAASTAQDVLSLVNAALLPPAERAFLEQVSRFFNAMNEGFELAQRGAKRAKAKADAEYKAKHQALVAETIRKMFGDALSLETVRATALAALEFSSKETRLAEAKRLGVDRAYFFINREYDLRAALKRENVQEIARELAELRLDLGERGRRWIDSHEEACHTAGWEDFSSWVQREKNGIDMLARAEAGSIRLGMNL